MVDIQYKVLLTLDEAADYTGVGIAKLRKISNSDDCEFVVWNGKKRLFKRTKLAEYLEESYSI